MTVFQAIVLGVIQGLSEFLPISSSAHLRLTPWLVNEVGALLGFSPGWQEPGLAFDVALHVGTLIALVWYFWQEWVTLARAFFSMIAKRRLETESERRVAFVIVATIPGGIAGYLLSEQADTIFRTPALNGIMLILMGLVLWLVDRGAKQERDIKTMGWREALIVGFAQMFAIIPGVSRSGSTITAGRAAGMTREAAAVFSFLLSLPIITAAVVFKGSEAIDQGVSLPLVCGVVAAAISGWLAIRVLMTIVSRKGYGVFAVYRFIVGAIVLAVVFLRG